MCRIPPKKYFRTTPTINNTFSLLLLVFLNGILAQIHPQQVHIALTEKPNEIAVSWVTIEKSPESIVEYGLIPPDVAAALLATQREERFSAEKKAATSKTELSSREPETLVQPEVAGFKDEEDSELEAAETIRIGSKTNTKIIKEKGIKGHSEDEEDSKLHSPEDQEEDNIAPKKEVVSTTTTTELPVLPVLRSVGQSFSMVPGVFDIILRHIHRVKLTGLEPDSLYWYRCGGPDFGWTKNYTFRTLPSGTDWSPRLAVFGDLGYVNGKILKHLIKHSEEGTIDAIVHSGDIGYDLHLEEGLLGDRFMDQIEPVSSRTPYMVSPGNHESFRNFTNFKTRFWMPGDQDNMMYTFTIGPLRVISVSTEAYYFFEYGGAQPITWQYAWLENTLKEANRPENRRKQPWILLSGHRPMYCSNNVLRTCSSGNSRVRDGGSLGRGKGLERLLYDYGVDVAFWGHQHSYERLWPTYDKEIYNGSLAAPYVNPRAPVHFIVGCAGNNEARHRFLKTPPKWSAFRSLIFGFAHLTVANKSHLLVQYQSHDPKSPLVDEVWIVKDAHGPYPRLYPLDNRSRAKIAFKSRSGGQSKRRRFKTFG